MLNQNEKFIIGLGNPGSSYSQNRHNIGFLLIEEFVKKHNSTITLKTKLKSHYSEFRVNQLLFRVFMPITFMNNSGEAIRAILDWFKIDQSKIIVIVDDIDIPLGKIRFRQKGGSGGHNGLKSIINNLKSQDFKRIRIGIGSPPEIKQEKQFNTISHVLGNLSTQELLILQNIYPAIMNALEILNEENEDSIISQLNSFKIKE